MPRVSRSILGAVVVAAFVAGACVDVARGDPSARPDAFAGAATAGSDGLVIAAAPKPYCGRGRGKRRRVAGGWVCRKGGRKLKPRCRRGYRTRARGRGWVCRKRSVSAPAPVPPTPAPPVITNQDHINATFDFAKRHGNYLMSSQATGDPITFGWYIYRSECTVPVAATGRCVLYVKRSTLVPYGVRREVNRVIVFARHVGNRTYDLRYDEIDWLTPYGVYCDDSGGTPGAPNCDGPLP